MSARWSGGRCSGSISRPQGSDGRLAEELLVPPVADPADPLREQQARRDGVHEPEDAVARALHDDRAGEAAEEDPAPDAEAALPDRERRPPLVDRLHLVPRRDVVVEARADDPEADAPDGDAEDEIPVAAAAHPADAGEPDARRRCRGAASGRTCGSRAARGGRRRCAARECSGAASRGFCPQRRPRAVR